MKTMLVLLVIGPIILISLQCGPSTTSPWVDEDVIAEIIDLDLEITDLEEEAELNEEQSTKADKFETALGLLNRIIRHASKLVSNLEDESKSNDLTEIKKLRNKAKKFAEDGQYGRAFINLRESRIKAVGLIMLISGEEYSVRKQKKYYIKLYKLQENVSEKIALAKSELEKNDTPASDLVELLEKATIDLETAMAALSKWHLERANKYFLRARHNANKILKTLNIPLDEAS